MRSLLTRWIWGCGLCIVLFLVVQPVWGQEQGRQSLFQKATSAYGNGQYTQAITGFETLVQEGLSAPLLYNLGNSYVQDGQIGKAILNYERALRLAPGDSDIRGNLELVRKDKGLFQEERSYGQRFIALLGLNQWLALGTLAFVLGAGIVLLPFSFGLRLRTRYGIGLACLLVVAVTATGGTGQYRHWHDGVVVVSDARLRVSPFESAASVGTIQEGRLLHPGKIHNNYVLVVDESGRSGWLVATAFEAIATPEAFH